MGIVLIFIGVTGHAFNLNEVKELNKGDSMRIGAYSLQMVDLQQGENENYQWHRATMQVAKNGDPLGTLEPEKRFYTASKQGTSEVGVRSRLNEDLYLNFRRHVGRQPARGDPGVRLPAGFVDLDRRPGADWRHPGVPGSEQDQDAIRPHGSGGRHEKTCDASRLVCWPYL